MESEGIPDVSLVILNLLIQFLETLETGVVEPEETEKIPGLPLITLKSPTPCLETLAFSSRNRPRRVKS